MTSLGVLLMFSPVIKSNERAILKRERLLLFAQPEGD